RCEKPMAFVPSAPLKSLSTILLELYLNHSLPTDSAEEPKKHIKNRRWLQYLVENKCSKNVSFGA
ncbi:MAG: hypothetical protein ABSF45_30940, partial [Terriglobia bacterium]